MRVCKIKERGSATLCSDTVKIELTCVPTTFIAPFATIAILLHRVSASSIMCVVIMIARSGVANDDKRLQISILVEGSNPVVGSSSNNTFGAPSREMAIDSLLLMPPDKAPLCRVYTSGTPSPTACAMSIAALGSSIPFNLA